MKGKDKYLKTKVSHITKHPYGCTISVVHQVQYNLTLWCRNFLLHFSTLCI